MVSTTTVCRPSMTRGAHCRRNRLRTGGPYTRRASQAQPASPVLDLGAGTGISSREELLELAGVGAEHDGLRLSDEVDHASGALLKRGGDCGCLCACDVPAAETDQARRKQCLPHGGEGNQRHDGEVRDREAGNVL